ncbi:MAG: hypothetical protein K9W43_11110 [Candidatus Thorarchaeota archaeon]|nr:hypothetical protein [Candidatus Thorarchaeota archaeon]
MHKEKEPPVFETSPIPDDSEQIQSTITQIIKQLAEATIQTAHTTKNNTEAIGRLTTSIQELIESQKTVFQRIDRNDQQIAELIESQKTVFQRIDRNDQQIAELTVSVRELIKSQQSMENRFTKQIDYLVKSLKKHTEVLSRGIERAVDTAIIEILREFNAKGMHYAAFDSDGIVFSKGSPVEINVISLEPPLIIEFTNALNKKDIDTLLKKVEFLEKREKIVDPIIKYITFACSVDVCAYAERHGIEVITVKREPMHESWSIED